MTFQSRYYTDGYIRLKYCYIKFKSNESWILESIWYRYDNSENWKLRQ